MTADHRAPDALFHAIDQGAAPAPRQGERVLFLRAREAVGLQRWRGAGWHCAQTFRPLAAALEQAGFTVAEPAPDARYDHVLALPPRQRDEARAVLARAVRACAPGGRVIAAMANDEGARSGEKDLAALAGLGGSLSKSHCRVFWTPPLDAPDESALLRDWLALDALRPILDGRYVSRPGLFAWDRIDPASALLAAHLPADLQGRVADLGAGWGYLAAELLARCPGIVRLDLYEAEARALEAARRNLDGARCAVALHWHDVTRGLVDRYDAIVSNPPFHRDRADDPGLGRAFIERAADALADHGNLYLVANRHLPYEATLDGRFADVAVLAGEGGFKVFRARGVRR
ncbi:class I SAM-dependent methyltransferase [Coralloluteibacterium thermophilus]|uniref:Class I SAM-dependent methyltransferase n=1 Tax=Coralloluteibacterium thermophilum TaxID=2707049 RepID=A0ABV9NPG6_9GAMM